MDDTPHRDVAWSCAKGPRLASLGMAAVPILPACTLVTCVLAIVRRSQRAASRARKDLHHSELASKGEQGGRKSGGSSARRRDMRLARTSSRMAEGVSGRFCVWLLISPLFNVGGRLLHFEVIAQDDTSLT